MEVSIWLQMESFEKGGIKQGRLQPGNVLNWVLMKGRNPEL